MKPVVVDRLLVIRVTRRLDKLNVISWARALCKQHRVEFTEVVGSKTRSPMVVRARHEMWCVLMDTLVMSFPDIAFVFEVDHTTVVHAWHKRQEFLAA